MEKILNIAKALSDGNRLRALMLLRNGELCVCHLIDLLGLAPSTVSKHMAVLKQASLVEARREGKWTYYRLPGNADGPAEPQIVSGLMRQLQDDPKIIADSLRLEELRRRTDAERNSAREEGRS